MLLGSTFLAVAMLTDSLKGWLLETFHKAWSVPPPPVSTPVLLSIARLQAQLCRCGLLT